MAFKKLTLYPFFFIGSLLLGFLFFLVHRQWIVFRWIPSFSIERASSDGKTFHKKVSMFYWKEGRRIDEPIEVIWNNSIIETTLDLVGSWLSFVYQERLIHKHVLIQDVAVSAQDIFVSFDQPLFERDWSINKKWQLLDGLFRTIVRSGLDVKTITFLVNHEKMNDDHLDFSQPWHVALFE